jgi:hypothetical protein
VAPRSLPLALVAPLTCALSACAGGVPLLHPAQTLGPGQVRAVAGFSSNIALGGLSAATRNAANEPAAGSTVVPSRGDVTYAKGALALASVGPGVAPVAGARVGLGAQFEAGIAYTGRAVRVDVRRSFDLSDTTAISIGVGGLVTLAGRDESDTLPEVNVGRIHGWGADIPVLIGYRSTGDLYMVWAGARAGWEHIDVDDLSDGPGVDPDEPPPGPISLSATRFWGGGLLGAAVGFRHLHVAMELDVSYASVTGDYDATHAHVAGVALAPAAALWWRF